MIENSVGQQGANHANDVVIIQSALNVCRAKSGQKWIAIDGRVGQETVGAITTFQRQERLQSDGRVDPNGPTVRQLKKIMGEEAAVFGPALSQILDVLKSVDGLASSAPARVKPSFYRVTSQLRRLTGFKDLAAKAKGPQAVTLAAFGGRPNVIGFTGVEEGGAILALALLVFLVASVLIIMTQSPAFRKAVEERAKELDRIMGELKIKMNVGFNDAIQLVVSITNDTIGDANRCQASPAFNPSPECLAAVQQFSFVIARIRNQFNEVIRLVLLFTASSGRGLSMASLRTTINDLIARMQLNAVDLQVALADMKAKCNCPEI